MNAVKYSLTVILLITITLACNKKLSLPHRPETKLRCLDILQLTKLVAGMSAIDFTKITDLNLAFIILIQQVISCK